MALGTCPDCGHCPLSLSAECCPTCGCTSFVRFQRWDEFTCKTCDGMGRRHYADVGGGGYVGWGRCNTCFGAGKLRRPEYKDARCGPNGDVTYGKWEQLPEFKLWLGFGL